MKNLKNITSNLNEEQLEAITNSDSRILCLAGAGTGKTRVLISRVLYKVNELEVNPASIVCLTFTRNAAEEMNIRYCENSENSSTIPFFGTFHSYCYSLLISNFDILKKLGYKKVPEIIDETQENYYYEKARFNTKVSLSKRANSIEYNPSYKEKFEYNLLQKEIKKLLKRDSVITYDRICYYVVDALKSDSSLLSQYSKYISNIFIDEFQDTDKLQWEFIKLLSKYASIFIVGDINQAIYQFRGGDSSIIKSINSDSAWTKCVLSHNYRSTVQICEYANTFINECKPDNSVNLKSDKSGSDVNIINKSDFIKYLKLEASSHKSISVLTRSNKTAHDVRRQLESCKIQYESNNGTHYDNLIYSSIDSEYLQRYFFGKLNANQKKQLLADEDTLEPNNYEVYYRSIFEDDFKLIDQIRNSEIFGELQTCYYNNDLQKSSISKVLNFISRIYIGTIHSVKGLEFDTVFVYNVNSDEFKIESSEELQNLFYVAITRAKNCLYIVNS